MAPNQTALLSTTMSSLTTQAATNTLPKKYLHNYVNLAVGSKYRRTDSILYEVEEAVALQSRATRQLTTCFAC
eukprot:scaffold304884_cov56-Attheya_sp.AAC.1